MESENVFLKDVLNFVRSSFHYLEKDPLGNERIFFENSGGSLPLKSAVEEYSKYAAFPDSSARNHHVSQLLHEKTFQGINDIRLFLNAKNGTIAPFHTASKAMFEIIRVITENISGTNIVTTSLDHPSSYDACQIYGVASNQEVRVAQPNSNTGAVEVESIINLIDENTSLLSFILTSNITGAIHDVEEIVQRARSINPDIYIVVDAVQYAAHDVIDVEGWQVDALTIAPYKMFGNRGVGFAYLSDRLATLPHHKLKGKPADDWMLGSLSPAFYASFSAIVDYIVEIGKFFNASTNRRKLIVEGMQRIKSHEQELLKRLINGSEHVEGLKDISGVNIHFLDQPYDKKDPILAISFDNISASEAVAKYEANHVIVFERAYHSIFSRRILNSVKVGDIIRVSPLHCHTSEEMDRFLQVTREIAKLG